MLSSTVTFGDFRLDAARRELWRGEELMAVPARVFDCIAYLIEHRDRAVGRDELIAAIWGRTIVVDNLLDQVVLRARRALDDMNGERHVIRTVPRFGYSWVAPVECVDPSVDTAVALDNPGNGLAASTSASPAIESVPSPVRRVDARKLAAITTALILFVAIGAALWWSDRSGTEAQSTVEQHGGKLAMVLPIDIQAGSEFSWARLGAMDLVATRLRAAGLAVVPSDNAVALARGFETVPSDPAELDALANAARATLILAGYAESRPNGWHVGLRTLHGREPPLTAQGEALDLLDAARAASDNMATLLGLSPPQSGQPSPREHDLATLLQKVKAATLADNFDDARSLLDNADAEQRALPEVRYQRGLIDLYSGRYQAAQAAFESLISDVSAADDPLLRGQALCGLGRSRMRQSDNAAADRHLSAAIELLQGIAAPGARHELGLALSGRAGVRILLGQFQTALADFAVARVPLESSGDVVALAGLDSNLGVLNVKLNRYTEALSYFERAADRLATFNTPRNELRIRQNIAKVHLALLDPAAALTDEPRLRELVIQVADPQLKQTANLARADVLRANGHTRAAHALMQQILDEAPRDDPILITWAHVIAAQYAQQEGRFEDASDEARAALRRAWETDVARDHARTWLVLVRSMLALDQVEGAGAAVADAQAWAAQSGIASAYPSAQLDLTVAAAEQAAAAGKDDVAKAAFEQALAQADATRVPADSLEVCASYVAYLIESRDLSRATTIAERLSGWIDRDYDAALVQLSLYHALGDKPAWQVALIRAQALAGERVIPPGLASTPITRQ